MDFLIFTRDEVDKAANGPLLDQGLVAKACQQGNLLPLRLWVARAIHRQMIATRLGLWHWAKWKLSGLSWYDYAISRTYDWLQKNPIRPELV